MQGIKHNWSVKDLWITMATPEERPLVKRDYIYASEVGLAPVDRWLKMNAVPYTNPFNERATRKMQMGNMYEAWIKYVLMRTGILKEVQERIHIDYEGLLSVHGKQDFMAGGVVDPDKFKWAFESDWIPQELKDLSGFFMKKYVGKELELKSIEVKSISSYAADSMEKWDRPIKNHALQAFHYAKGQNMDGCTLLYVCRDDARAFEYVVPNNSSMELKYIADVKNMTKYITENVRPPIEPLHYFDYDLGKFSKNLGVEYSSYLTMLYGFQSPREYSESIKPSVERWNRVIKRYANGDKITPKNEEVRDEILKMGYDFDGIIFTVQELNPFENDKEEV